MSVKHASLDQEKTPSRYSRQVLFPGLGEAGQRALSASRVALIGCGALGGFQASLLVRAGVGTVRLIDRDFVEESNLQRQILFDEEDVRSLLPKAVAAEKKLQAANSQVRIESFVEDVNPSTINRLLDGFDLVLDAADNFDVRFLLNDYCVKRGVPWIYGACVGAGGAMLPIIPGETACLRCVFESAPPTGASPTCDTAGVIGPIVGVVASFQVAEAFKILAGCRDRVSRRLIEFDLWGNQVNQVSIPARNPGCPSCGKREFPYLEGALGLESSTLCGRNSVQIGRSGAERLDLDVLATRLSTLMPVERNRFLLRIEVDGFTMTVFADGRAIVGGTTDVGVAKSLYARYVGA